MNRQRHRGMEYEALQREAFELEIGTGSRTYCPDCHGGSSKEKSLSLYRSNNFTAHATCFRASCDFGTKKFKLYHADGELITAQTPEKARRMTTKNYQPTPTKLTLPAKNWLKRKFNFSEGQLAYAQVQMLNDGRIVYPIFASNRARRGYVLRRYHNKPLTGDPTIHPTSIPKAMNLLSRPDSVVMSWYFKDKGAGRSADTLIITEDIPSSVRCIDHCDSVALLGTVLSEDKIKEIRKLKYKHIYLCLDADANKKIVRSIAKHRALLDMKTKFLPKDLKDMSTEELHEFMAGVHL